jgi:hypothetical protein
VLWLYLIPLYLIGLALIVFGTFALLSRIRGGRYLRPVVAAISRVPLLRRLMERATKAALERQNPDLASALRKLERAGATRDPQRAQAALSRLTPAERRAYMDAAGQQGAMPSGSNREQRRRMERMKRSQQGR